MKIGIFMTGLLSVVATATFAQKGELSNAQSELDKYEASRQNSITAALATQSITNAKTSIDKAAANEKTAALPQTFALKGAVYSALALRDTVPATSAPLFSTADEAQKKAIQLDTKGENKKLIDYTNRNLAQYQLTKGVKEYQAKKFGDAYKSFDYYRTIMPEDTNAIYYTGLAAVNSENYPAAITNYNKLLTTNYSGKDKIYQDLTSIYLASKDTAGALKIADEAVAKFPNNGEFRKRAIEIELQSGKQQEVLSKITSAIAADPKNKTLYYYAGLTYSGLAENAAKSLKAAAPAAKAALQKTKEENFTKAADMYKKALEIDPNYFEANLNLGFVLINPAIDAYNAANKLPASKQKEYDAAVAKANAMFDAAGPYLKKAVELNPKSPDALGNLKTYYLGKKDQAHAAEVQKQIDALK
ncbi:tetratricopeptide repeat protein [Mucilaginibacter sp. KACC 22063]|uniref:tetratricopeptide repeat protein n=1 Tax=Mucilaginibacter sp. KACC 22063 TaxID=3025666 RepID=UPI00236582C7|nr:tetratricopeptide repeat protein [Mucilaginibacter sp. KACC 22063]WDF53600.1 tetratricopeptide repeat protein [Mucilaginibacter sp. KACC 22063]